MRYKKTLEQLSDLEHQQWMSWSKALGQELVNALNFLHVGNSKGAVNILSYRMDRWRKNWKDYRKLPEDVKDMDREWAEKVIDSVPFKCPMHQCGGIMVAKERRIPKSSVYLEHWNGDEQSPDLICTNCGAIYQFQGFKKSKVK